MELEKKQVIQFQKEILGWYTLNQRDLPWRKTRDPYKILVSEIMLQQTQVSRVIPKYEAWLAAFPDVQSLANARKEEVLLLWSGLGYNRRALNLLDAAKSLELRAKEQQSKSQQLRANDSSYWPQTIEGLMELPGIGPYTARAVACFAFDQQVAVVDTNVRKVVLTQLLGIKGGDKNHESNREAGLFTAKEFQEIADQLLPQGRAYEWNQALMDYSSLVLQGLKVPLKRQSKFKDSNRFYRGKIVRILLEKKEVTTEQVGLLLRDDYGEKDREWRDTLLGQMEKEGLIVREEGRIRI